jgi:hypothetical protein
MHWELGNMLTVGKLKLLLSLQKDISDHWHGKHVSIGRPYLRSAIHDRVALTIEWLVYSQYAYSLLGGVVGFVGE